MSTINTWTEQHPTHCPNNHPWNQPGTYLPGWDSSTTIGHRTWTCTTCWAVIHATPGQTLLQPPT
ncbi:hypothetical protein [Corynebacterium crudilactis]|uniref:hypothetical protein n=1 Tax=Corynebacterium crudilactis TaxID=1652495 RepID=UPI0012FDF662|nr:hypothetical protein [Corynebacterium crudilactis]